MVKRMARVCCVSVLGLIAACGGSRPNGDQVEQGESSPSFNAAGAPDVDGDSSPTGTETPPRNLHLPAGPLSAQQAPELGIGQDAGPDPEVPVQVYNVAPPSSSESDHGVFGATLGVCPPPCSVNTPRLPMSPAAAQPRATTP